MLIIKNRSNAVIELEGVKFYPGENKRLNIGYTPHIRNLENLRVIGVSNIEDNNYLSNNIEELPVEDPKPLVQDENVERIDISKVTDSISIDNSTDDKEKTSSRRSRKSKETDQEGE